MSSVKYSPTDYSHSLPEVLSQQATGNRQRAKGKKTRQPPVKVCMQVESSVGRCPILSKNNNNNNKDVRPDRCPRRSILA